MTVYLDEAFRCHAQPEDGYLEAAHPFFDGKCEEMIEAYRYVPEGAAWTRADGRAFPGEMIAPHGNLAAALASQRVYDEVCEHAAEYAAAYEAGVKSAWA